VPKKSRYQQPEGGGHCAHLAAAGIAEMLAIIEQAGRATRSGWPLLQPCWVEVATTAVVHNH
jgi:hypothetical protein